MENIGIFMKIWTIMRPYISWLLKKKKIENLDILFIDDQHESFNIIKTLKESKEYGSVESIGDLDNLNNLYLKKADIIFLDILGIGKKMNLKNGASLVDRIYCKYPDKLITIYSSRGIPKNSHIKAGVTTIPKNSSYEIFSSHIKTLWESKK